jgi:hypothetical protein
VKPASKVTLNNKVLPKQTFCVAVMILQFWAHNNIGRQTKADNRIFLMLKISMAIYTKKTKKMLNKFLK